MGIESLKMCLKDVMVILDANIEAARAEWMAGTLSQGAFGYVRTRHALAHEVLDRTNIAPETAFHACAMLAIDLRSGAELVPAELDAAAKIEAWWQCYRDQGFTEVNGFFDSPCRPTAVQAA